MVDLVRLQRRPSDWDEVISRYATKTLFHESCWLDFVRVTHAPCEIVYYKITDSGHVLGYFCYVVKRKFGLRLAGSPLSGAGMFSGPIVGPDVDQYQLVAALNGVLARDGVGVLAMCAESLRPDVMAALGFRATVVSTHIRPLAEGEAQVWATMHGTCRTRIRKAIKSGVTVELATDPMVARELFGFYSDALARRGLKPAFDVQYYESLIRHLGPDRVISLRAKAGGRTIGAGLYLHDDRCMYYWDGASRLDQLGLSPNELLHWTAIQVGIKLSIPTFHMAGSPRPSRFTRKFGGHSVPYIIYRRQYLPFADLALRLLDRLRDRRLKIVRKWRLRCRGSTPDVARPT
jgi:hypothetical protein